MSESFDPENSNSLITEDATSKEPAPEMTAAAEPAADRPGRTRRLFRKSSGSGPRRTVRNLYLLAFFVPVFIVTAIYLVSEVWPVGSQCFMKTDMYHQYIPFLAEFRHKLVNGESLLFTWNVGLGVNFIAMMAYYLASPLNWLVILAPENHVIEFLNILMILKLGLAGMSFTFYLRSHARKRRDLGSALFGIAYALSGYICAYYWNTMWLDCIVLFPLIVGALERLIKGGRMFPYAALLGLCIFSNYYISIMICIFLVLYFAAMNLLHKPETIREFLLRCLRFAAGSLTAGMVAAVFLLPAFYALTASASASSTFPKAVKSYFSVVEMLARMQPCVETEQVLAHWPNIYSGTFVFILLPLYLMCDRISLREKAVYITFAAFLLASFSTNVLDYIWHGFHYPNSLPCRQSFCFVFLVLFMAFRAYEKRNSFSVKQICIALVSAGAFLLLVQKGADEKYYDFYVTWMALALCGLYALVLVLYRERKLSRSLAFLAAFLLVAVEVTANAAVTGFSTCDREYYTKEDTDIRAMVSQRDVSSAQVSQGDVSSAETPNGFWRYERGTRRTKNDGAWLSFPSVSLFSSTASAACSELMTKLGCEASTNAYSITGATPLVDMLLGVRWYISSTDLSQSGEKEVEGRSLYDESGETWLYENECVLPVGCVLPEKIADGWCFEFSSPILTQNSICDALGVPQVLEEVTKPGNSSGASYTIYTGDAGEYYAYVTNTAVKEASVSIDGESKTFKNLTRGYLIELGQLEANTMVKFTSKTDGEDMEVSLYRFNYDALRQAEAVLQAQSVTVEAFDSDSLRVSVQVDGASAGYSAGEKAVLCFSIPYDTGWKVKVDGENVTPVKGFNDAFLCLELDDGAHTVEMEFVPEGLKAGAAISLLGIAALVLLWVADRRHSHFAS